MTLQLSSIRPDFEDIVEQLQSVLSGYSSWQDLLTSSTGQTLIEFNAAIGAYAQYAVESAFQETFPLTAKNDSSIYAIAQMLGIRLVRKAPAEITVDISAPAPTVIPAYSQFSGSGSVFFNRNAISIDSTPQSVKLYQGQVQVINISGLGTDYQIFLTPEKDFNLSDADTKVALNGESIAVTRAGLWQLKNIEGVLDDTTPDGRLGILFGNDEYGTKPLPSDVITISYVVTSGEDGNNLVTNGNRIGFVPDSTVVVTATSDPAGGANQPSSLIYKSLSAPTFGTFASAVTSQQYKSLPFLYPGVVDLASFAQREINPHVIRRMNMVELYLLTSSAWTEQQKQGFINWYQDRTMYSTRVVLNTPTAYTLNVELEVYCRNTALLSQIKQQVEAAIVELLKVQSGSINRSIFRSDLIRAAMDANPAVAFVVVYQPTTEIVISRRPVGFPTLTAVAGGTLTQEKTYDYAISYVSTLGGEVSPANWKSTWLPTGANSSIKLDWTPTPNVSEYKIWGRNLTDGLGLIATVPASQLTYTDTGAIAPVPPLLEESTQPIFYVELGTLTVRALFTNRQPLPK